MIFRLIHGNSYSEFTKTAKIKLARLAEFLGLTLKLMEKLWNEIWCVFGYLGN